MIQERITRQHRVLIGAEIGKAVGEEMRERRQRARPVRRPAERAQAAEIRGEPRFDQCQNLLRHRIRRDLGGAARNRSAFAGLRLSWS